MNNWSNELQTSTREVLDSCRFGVIDGYCHLKKWCETGSLYGVISLEDALSQNWVIKNPDDKLDILGTYSDIDTLIQNGWAID